MTNEPDELRTDPASAEAHFAAWAARVEGGKALDFGELLAAHPSLADELQALHADWLLFAPLLGKVVPGLAASSEELRMQPLSGNAEEAADMPSAELLDRLGIHAPNVGRYRFRAVLGRGGGGVVLKVWDTKLNRALAMKVVLGRGEQRPSGQTPRVDGRTLTRFVDEARIASQLNHPGIVPVHELGADETGRAFFTMRLVKGEDLARIFEHVKTGHDGWNVTRALGVLLKVCEAMAFAHTKGVVHRDLKPANVMVGRYGEVHVMDWGLARVLGETEERDVRVRQPDASSGVQSLRSGHKGDVADSALYTMDGDVVGTPAYMSPEQAAGDLARVGPRSDVYAVGAMLYQLLAGHMPYVPEGAKLNAYAVWQRVQEGPPASIAGKARAHPVELVAICERAMAREPNGRYSDMLELARDLRAYLEQRVVQAYETGAWAEARKWIARNNALAAALITAFAFAISGAALLAERNVTAKRLVDVLTVARRSADISANLALRSAAHAEARADEARRNGYVAAIAAAEGALRSGENAAARRLLRDAPMELRNWEWHYLNAQADTSLMRFEGHAGRVLCINWSPAGKRLVSASEDGTARVWDVDSGKQVLLLDGHNAPVYAACFTDDGSLIVTAGSDDTVRSWDVSSGLPLATFEGKIAGTQIRGSPARIHAAWSISASVRNRNVVTISPLVSHAWAGSESGTGKLFGLTISGGGDYVHTRISYGNVEFPDPIPTMPMQVHRLDSGQRLSIVQERAETPHAIFSHDGNHIVALRPMGIWSTLGPPEPITLATTNAQRGMTADCSRDGSLIVTADALCGEVWSALNGDLLTTLSDPDGHRPTSARFSADGRHVVTTSWYDMSPRVWDVASGKRLLVLNGHTQRTLSSSFSSNGKYVLTCAKDNTARLWSALDGSQLVVVEAEQFGGAEFSPTGDLFATASSDNSVSIWDVRDGTKLVLLDTHDGWRADARFDPTGSRIITASSGAQVFSAWRGELLARLQGPDPEALETALYSNDGSLALSAGATVQSWDATLGVARAQFGGPQLLADVSLSSDDRRIATASWDNLARLWERDGAHWVQRREYKGHTGGVTSVSFSADNSRLITASDDGTARLWSVATGDTLLKFVGHAGSVRSAKISPNGAHILTASRDGSMRVWDSSTGTSLLELRGHSGSVNDASYSPDSTRIVSASDDHSVRIWDAASARQLARLEGHTGAVCSANFSPDGTQIVTASLDGTVRIWDSLLYRVRYTEHGDLEAAEPEAEALVQLVATASADWAAVAARVREHVTPGPLVQRLALDALTRRANRALFERMRLPALRAQRIWTARMLGEQPWPTEEDVAAEYQDADVWEDETALYGRALGLVDLDGTLRGNEVRACRLLKRALTLVLSRADEDVEAVAQRIVDVADCRSALAVALVRLGRFDEALEQQLLSCSATQGENECVERRQELARIEDEIKAWRHASGSLRVAEWRSTLAALDAEIFAVEQNPDVVLWPDDVR